MKTVCEVQRQQPYLINTFWDWFLSQPKQFKISYEDEVFLAELDAQVSALHDGLAWEVRPGDSAENALVISPDGDPDLLPLTKRIVSMAPSVTGWEFYFARPSNPSIGALAIQVENGNLVQVDPQDWRYCLFKYSDGKCDMVLEVSNPQLESQEDKYAAAIMVLDGILGEEARMNRFIDIDVTPKLEEEFENRSSTIQHLAAHLQSLSPT